MAAGHFLPDRESIIQGQFNTPDQDFMQLSPTKNLSHE